MKDWMTIQAASVWASDHLGKEVTPSNISYLLQYGRVPKRGRNGNVGVLRSDLKAYYAQHAAVKEKRWKARLGGDLNWKLSFSECKEAETTKHVHRLHPYKGKFIPQLVEYFLDGNTDEFKAKAFFCKGDIILDPFCGSGTTLVQANELGMHAVGIDVSSFNAFISNAKISDYDIDAISSQAAKVTEALNRHQKTRNNLQFEKRLLDELSQFNARFFPSPEFKLKVRQKTIDEHPYAAAKLEKFIPVYERLIKEHRIRLVQRRRNAFMDKWFLAVVREEIDFVFEQIKSISDKKTKMILGLALSRTVRSCRATTHADLGTLKEPVVAPYYCKKHGKVCKPLFNIAGWWHRYAQDTIKRLLQFDQLRTPTRQHCLLGDSRTIDVIAALDAHDRSFARLAKAQKFAGIFTSPPYVGLIDYHQQHAYAYDLFGFARNDELEIGPLYKGQGVAAKKSYIEGVSTVLRNLKPCLKPDYDVFLVANDKHGLYPMIADNSEMRIVNQYKRPVLNRVEKDRSAYAETIFHLKDKQPCR